MKTSVLLLWLFLFIAGNVFAQSEDLRKREYNLERSGLALEGYDPVSYFTMSEPEKGRKEIALTHDGVVYWFATNENRDLFRADPEKYEPKYGGWCAYAMGAKGEKVEVDPETFKIIDGKLYLFYNKFFNNTLDSWNKDEPRLKSNADRNWSKIIQQGK
ncbi:MAG TPA: YHS domain-containing (seleno)protein [Cyclobacteriaceae bacterium]